MTEHVNQQTEFNGKVTRRNVLTAMVALVGMAWGGMTLYPIFRYLTPRKKAGGKNQVSSVVVGDVKDIPVGSGKNFQFGSVPAILTRTGDKEFFAYNAICTHLGCTVQYNSEMSRIWCACHGGQYDPATGKNVAGPPPKPLEPLKVAVTDGKITVSKA